MTDAHYKFLQSIEFPVLFLGAFAIPACLAAVHFFLTRSTQKRYVWVLWFILFGIISLTTSLVFVEEWFDSVELPLADADHSDPNDPYGNDHQGSNIVALLFALVAVSGGHVFAFGLAAMIPDEFRKLEKHPTTPA